MTVAHGLITVLVYVAIALLSTLATSQSARRRGDVTIFPILRIVRILVWAGGLFCAVAGVEDVATEGIRFTGLLLIVVSLGTLLVPLQSVAISSTGVESLPILFMKRVTIPWENIQRVEYRKRGRLIVVLGDHKSITHTRFNADPVLFEELLTKHVDARATLPRVL